MQAPYSDLSLNNTIDSYSDSQAEQLGSTAVAQQYEPLHFSDSHSESAEHEAPALFPLHGELIEHAHIFPDEHSVVEVVSVLNLK